MNKSRYWTYGNDEDNPRVPAHWADVDAMTALGRQIYDLMFPPDTRGDTWIMEDFEETMITTLVSLRLFAEDVECLTWEHLSDNAENRFRTEIARAFEMDARHRPTCNWCQQTNTGPLHVADGWDVCDDCYSIYQGRVERGEISP